MIVEKEFTTPLGMALFEVCKPNIRYRRCRGHLRCEDTDEDQDRLRVEETQFDLTLVERFVLDSSLVASNTLDSNESLALVKKGCIRRRVGQYYPYNQGPDARGASELLETCQ
jgi:hypothetical protein